uniref:Myb-like protein AA n=1 Tax=Globodera pallida TaxID=36090 RepID=A0A183CFQ4_GLOPA
MALTETSDTNATKTTICANDKGTAAEAATNNGTNLCNNNSTRVGAFRHKIVCRVCCWSSPTVLMFLAFCCVLLSSFGPISNAELTPSNLFNTENANNDNAHHQQPQPQQQSQHAILKRATKMHQKQRQQQTEEAQQQFTDDQRMPPLVLLKLLDDVEADSDTNNNNNLLPLIHYKLAMGNSRSLSSTEENICK